MSEKTKINLSIALLWTILTGVSAGVWCAAGVYGKVTRIEQRLNGFEELEKDVIRIKAKLDMSKAESVSTYTSTANR